MSDAKTQRDLWRDQVVRAAAEASRLEPLALGLFVVAILLIVGDYATSPFEVLRDTDGDLGAALQQGLLRDLLEAIPSAILAWALWETRTYLAKLAQGGVWGPATALLLGRIGDCLLWAAGAAMLVVPSLQMWTEGEFHGFDWRFEPIYLVLFGLGLLLSLIARVVRNVVEVAAALKAENDEIV